MLDNKTRHQQNQTPINSIYLKADKSGEDKPAGLPFRLNNYLELIDWSGRIIRNDKKGTMDATTPPILQRLDLDATQFIYLSRHFESPFKNLVGAANKVRQVCEAFGQQ